MPLKGDTDEDRKANEALTGLSIPAEFVDKKDYLWAQNSLDTVRRLDGGVRWLKVVQAWYFLENSREWRKSSNMLSTTNRSIFVGLWIQRARKPWRAGNRPISEHEDTFWAWWSGLQPEWRLGEIDLNEDDTTIADVARLEKLAPPDKNWEEL